MTPWYVSLYLGAGADYLHLLGADLVPLCSWMGGKRREAPAILRALGLRAGRMILGQRVGERIPCLLGDASWWGWVWPVVLCPVDGPRVEYFLRSWRNEDPRALWFRLRDLGPVTDDVAHAAAQLLWLQARAASGVPVWWEGAGTWAMTLEGWQYVDAASGALVQDRGWKSSTTASRTPFAATQAHPGTLTKWDRTRRGNTGPANQAHAPDPGLVQWSEDGSSRRANAKGFNTPRLLQEASTQVDDAGQRQAKDPRLLAGKRPGDARDDRDAGQCHGSMLLASDGRGAPREAGARTTRHERLIATSRGSQEPGAPFEAGHKGTDTRGGGGIVDPGTIAARIAAVRSRLHSAKGDVLGAPTILNTDARAVTEEWAAQIEDAAVYLDPPYKNKTGYPATSPREDVLWIADTWARTGRRRRLVVSEAVGLAAELGSGWVEQQLREGEWITCYGCEPAAVRGAA